MLFCRLCIYGDLSVTWLTDNWLVYKKTGSNLSHNPDESKMRWIKHGVLEKSCATCLMY